ncbi:MAG: 50S ribosomal protein L6 [Acidimicrobiia bacterium]
MTRKGKIPIPVPSGVTVTIDQSHISVKGPKGLLEQELTHGVTVEQQEVGIVVSLTRREADQKPFQGLYRTLIHNMVHGVTQGFDKRLQMIGVGYRASVQGEKLVLQVGFSHPTEVEIPDFIEVQVEKNTFLLISGIDKQKVGQFAAQIRSIRPPEPYQGKGIRYVDEYVRKKAGKSASKK